MNATPSTLPLPLPPAILAAGEPMPTEPADHVLTLGRSVTVASHYAAGVLVVTVAGHAPTVWPDARRDAAINYARATRDALDGNPYAVVGERRARRRASRQAAGWRRADRIAAAAIERDANRTPRHD